jgi:predicted acetyltransferase
MTAAALRLARRRGAVVSALYPSAVPFYQSVGHERAGARFRATVDARELAGMGRAAGDVRVEPRSVDPDDELRDLQRRLAAEHEGALDRGSYVWQRTVRPWRSEPLAFGLRRGGRLVGHVVVVHRMNEGSDTELTVADASAEDEGAARALLGFLGGYRSLAGKVTMNLHVPGLLQALLPDRRVTLTVADLWMLRVLDVEEALATRGYRRAARGTVDLALDDPVIPECAGSFRLRIDEGQAAVTRGGSGAVRLGPRGLAALFSGFAGGRELARRGLAKGPPEALALLDELFTGPTPTMTEMF